MIVLPSLLEYSTEQLQQKIEILKTKDIEELTNQTDLSLHLDFVMKHFAIDRKVMESISFAEVHDQLMDNFEDRKLNLSIHFMGDVTDLTNIYKILEETEFNSDWNYLFLVPQEHIETFEEFADDNIEIGIWADLEDWPEEPEEDKTYLLMTVKAGLSGQKLTTDTKKKALTYIDEHPNTFILDGGWSIDFESDSEDLFIVSHSSFWNTAKNLDTL